MNIEDLVTRCRALAETTGRSEATVSRWVFADGKRLAALAAGDSYLRPPTYREALARLETLESAPPAPMNTDRNRPGRAPNDPPPRRRRNSQARAN